MDNTILIGLILLKISIPWIVNVLEQRGIIEDP